MKNFTKTLLFIGILLTLSNQSASIKVECKYEYAYWNDVGKMYTCDVWNNFHKMSPDNAAITSVTGIHEEGKSNNDVEAFKCVDRNVEYLPKGLENIFPNLKAISLYDNKIKDVHQSDLQPFPNLEILSLRRNLIKVIEEDLFKFNCKLKIISFTGNPITYIHSNVFDDLNELSYMHLRLLSCIDMVTPGVSNALIEVIKSKCNDTEYSALNEKIKNLEIHFDSLNISEFNQQLSEIEDNFKISKYSKSSTFQMRIEKLSKIKELKELKAKQQQILKALEEDAYQN